MAIILLRFATVSMYTSKNKEIYLTSRLCEMATGQQQAAASIKEKPDNFLVLSCLINCFIFAGR